MKAAWYERQGAARDVLTVGEMEDPQPHPGEVRIRVSASGINPGDVKKRQDAFGYGMPYPRVIPHSDGAGQMDQMGEGWIDADRSFFASTLSIRFFREVLTIREVLTKSDT